MRRPVFPCPVCGHELAPRIIPLRDWLVHPIRSWKRREFDRGYPAAHFLLNHGASETLHELSPSASARWSSP